MNAQATIKPSGRAAFTLVELMVVIGLMALLGTVSVTGYFAAVRGMADRAAKEDTVSLIRLAMQTCLIDQTPTAVLFYNRQTRVAGDGVSSEEVTASSAGSAVAIKMVGRISYVKNDVIVDEFADWNQSYPTTGSDNDKGIRFYQMSDLKAVAQGVDRCSSIVYTSVVPVKFDNEYMIASGRQVQHFCSDFKKNGADNRTFSGTTYDNGNNQRWGHQIKTANGIQWKTGDPYGMEIGSLDLPKGYVYGNQAASSTRIDSLRALTFNPADAADANTYELPLNQTITISAFRGQIVRRVGSITAKDLRDDAK